MKLLKVIVPVLVVVIVVGWLFGRSHAPERALAVRAADTSQQVGAAIDAATRGYVEETVRAAGFECPSLNSLRSFGAGARGTIFRAWCGPTGTEAVAERQVYRLDVGDRGAIRQVTAWEGAPDAVPAR
jgi:hypothetical protein